MSANDLAARWRKLMGASPAAAALGDELLRRWAEPHRRYHTLEHLAACLDAVDALADEADDVIAVRLAVWFHDAVFSGPAPEDAGPAVFSGPAPEDAGPARYDRRPGEDEKASAALAEDRLPRLGVAANRVAEVARLVRLTVTHQPAPDDRNGSVLCDADLSVLGGTPESYARYAAQIREEYADIDEAAFRTGRRRVLEAFAAREPLFRTGPAQALWEERARRNVRTELALLSVAG